MVLHNLAGVACSDITLLSPPQARVLTGGHDTALCAKLISRCGEYKKEFSFMLSRHSDFLAIVQVAIYNAVKDILNHGPIKNLTE